MEKQISTIKTEEYNNLMLLHAWTEDFVRAVLDKNKMIRLFFRLIIGRYAYREFCGIISVFKKDQTPLVNIGYGLERCDYHSAKTPLDFKEMVYEDKKYKHLEYNRGE